jgi:CRP/FNR family cyclic AMP-dependent transcriptional regulator
LLQARKHRHEEERRREVALFSGCTGRTLRRLSGLGTRVQMPTGRKLTTAGSRGSEVLIVLSGTATCQVHGVEVARFGPGDFFGEVAALDGGPRTATVVASTDMEVLVLTRVEFATLVRSSPEVAHRMLRAMAHRLRRANGQAVA